MKVAEQLKKPHILFITSNDGSDMRINKEVKSLHKAGAQVYFLGMAENESNCFVKPYCAYIWLAKGRRNSPFTLLKLVFRAWILLFSKNCTSIHIINEQLMVFFYPLLFFRHAVLDLFDSAFLKWNKPGNQLWLLKWLLYLPVNALIVTDERRFGLLPDFAKKKCSILPNYPYQRHCQPRRQRDAELCILFNGWMGLNRGTEIAEGLLKTGLPLKVIMAGWFSDEYTRNLPIAYPDKIDFRGVVPQETALHWTEHEADYILCVYAPVNTNNIYASPNKVYDAIQTGTPLIVNAETAISSEVAALNAGFVLKKYQTDDYSILYEQLILARNSYHWDETLRKTFSWENCEEILFKSHLIS